MERNQWHNIKRMKTAKSSAAAAVASDGTIFVGGGFENRGTSSNSVARYNPDTNEWTDVANTKCCLGRFALVEWKGSVHAIGGRCVDAVERYDCAKNEWTTVRNIPIHFFSTISWHSKLYQIPDQRY